MAEREQQFIPVDSAPIQKLTQFLPEDGIFSQRNVERAAINLADLADFLPGGSAYREAVDPFYEASDFEKTFDAGFFKNIPKYILIPYMQAVKKSDILKQTIKREGDNIPTDGRAAQVAQAKAKEELKKVNAQIKRFEEDIKTETGLDLSLPPAPPPAPMVNTKEGILSAIKEPSSLFHGSQTTGIKSLKLPEGYGSQGGVYLADKFNDPRVIGYAQGLRSKGPPGSTYVTRPDFDNVLDSENVNKQVNKALRNLQKTFYVDENVKNPMKAAYQVSEIRRGISSPNFLDKEVGQGIMNLGFDAIRFPTAKKLKRAGFEEYGDTVISLNPENTLDILEEVPYDQIDEFIRLLTK